MMTIRHCDRDTGLARLLKPSMARGRLRTWAALLGALVLSACAASTPPPRFSPVSPADANGPESTVPAPKPMLTGDGELAERPESTQEPAPGGMPGMEHHHQPPGLTGTEGGQMEHAAKDTAPETEATYTCTMHPQVSSKTPGKCPICGMTLVQKATKPKESQR